MQSASGAGRAIWKGGVLLSRFVPRPNVAHAAGHSRGSGSYHPDLATLRFSLVRASNPGQEADAGYNLALPWGTGHGAIGCNLECCGTPLL
jgi:hypothetical protein